MKNNSLEIVILGVGNGSSAVLHGQPSTSFAFLVDGKCHLLVDLGFGVTHSILKHLNKIPQDIYISHNHLDHSGELPVVSQICFKNNQRLRIWSEAKIEERLKKHRLNELIESGIDLNELVEWKTIESEVITKISNDISIKAKKSQHMETCFGIQLFYKNNLVISYSADSGYSDLYYDWLFEAPHVILDARRVGSYDHASFEDIENYVKTKPIKEVFIIHYGSDLDKPMNLNPLKVGQKILIKN